MLFIEMVIYWGWGNRLWMFGFIKCNWKFGLVGFDMLIGDGDDD